MATIGNLSLMLSANTSALSEGLSRAGARVKAFTRSATSTIGSLDTAFGGIKGAIGSTIGTALKPLQSVLSTVQSIATSVPFVGAAFAGLPLSIAGFISTVNDGADQVLKLYALSRKLGLDTQTTAGLMNIPGVSVESLESGFLAFNKRLTDAFTGDQKWVKNLNRLGLDAVALSLEPFDRALEKVVERYGELKSASEKAFLASTVFGDAGGSLLPFLEQGVEGIKAAKEQADQLGLSFSNLDAKGVQDAVIAVETLTLAWNGFKRQLAVQVAPYVFELTEAFKLGDLTLKDFAKSAVEVLKSAAEIGAGFYASWQGLKVLIDGLKVSGKAVGTVLLMAITGFMQATDLAVQKVSKLVSWLSKSVPGGSIFAGALKDAGLDLEVLASGQSEVTAKIAELRSYTESVIADLKKDASEYWETLGGSNYTNPFQKVAEFFSKVENRINNLKNRTAELKAQTDRTYDAVLAGIKFKEEHATPFDVYLRKMNELNSLIRAGAIDWKLYQRVAREAYTEFGKAAGLADVFTPQQEFARRLAEFKELLDQGAISWDIYARSVQSAYVDLANAMNVQDPKAPAALDKESAGAASAIAAFDRQESTFDIQRSIERVLKEAKQLQTRQVQQGEEILRSLQTIFARGI